MIAGQFPNSYIYTAWERMEYEKVGNERLARELYQKAIEVDPRSSSA